MSLYAMGDLHLSLGSAKPMEVFGLRWENYVERIREGFSRLNDDDVTVLCGDISWAMGLEEALEDFRFVNDLPGKKIILKGNHDYWWNTAAKLTSFFEDKGLASLYILHNNCFDYEGLALCGTKGWFYQEEKGTPQDEKIFNRELCRLEASLKAAKDMQRLCFLHYPPCCKSYSCLPIVDMLRRYGVKKCFYGHLHGPGHAQAIEGNHMGIDFSMVSADYLGFYPLKIC